MQHYDYAELLPIIAPFLPIEAVKDLDSLINNYNEMSNEHKYDLNVISLQQEQLQSVREKLRIELQRKDKSQKELIVLEEMLGTVKQANHSLEIANKEIQQLYEVEQQKTASFEEQLEAELNINQTLSKEIEKQVLHNKQLQQTIAKLSEQLTVQEHERKMAARKNDENTSEIEDFNMQIVSLEQALLQFKNENVGLEEQLKNIYNKGYQEGVQAGQQKVIKRKRHK